MPRPGGARPGPTGRPFGSVVVAGTLLVAAAGLAIVALGPWRVGLTVVGASMVLTSLARLLLPERHTGLLHVRHAGSDVVVLTSLGVAMIVLAQLIPDQPGL
ncbi:hypothetical protein BH20ACT6_BH20ACT6_02310 [soil metagenome]